MKIDTTETLLTYDCGTDSQHKAIEFCATHGIESTNCVSSLSTSMSRTQGIECGMLMEDWLERPVKDWLERLQWRILDQSTYHGVRTWKFPFDAWIYREILYAEKPTVIIEIGNFAGGSALLFADLFDTMEHHTGRIIAVDIDHSNVHEKARNHPRITWIEADAVEAYEIVAPMIHPLHDKVIVIEDASHTHAHTLAIMQKYGNLVTNGSYMIIEDTVLHNGVKNDAFNDLGAFAAVQDFTTSKEFGCGWEIQRQWERYIVTWNPTGFLQKIHPDGACNAHGPNQARFNLQQYHQQWKHAPLDYLRFINGIKTTWSVEEQILSGVHMHTVSIPIADGLFTFVPVPEQHSFVTVDMLLTRVNQACLEITQLNNHTECIAMIVAKVFSMSTALKSKTLAIQLHGWETNTPLHIELNEPGAAARAVTSVGVAITFPVLNETRINQLRNFITHKPSFLIMKKERRRYMNVMEEVTSSESKHTDSTGSVDNFVALASDSYVLSEVERVLGTDCIIDSTSVSIQWPGDAAFGPHVDRPFIISKKDDGHWPYSTTINQDGSGIGLPPREYPISVQVMWLLDDFSTSNGAFFYMPNTGASSNATEFNAAGDSTQLNGHQWTETEKGTRHNHHHYRQHRHSHLFPHRGVYPPQDQAQMVTGQAGSILFAHGGILHGAAPNMHSRPRIAFLVQYVPKFVRPGKQYRMHILLNSLQLLHTNEKRKNRLMELFDVANHADKKPTSTANPVVPPSKQKYFVRDSCMIQPPPFPVVAFGVGTAAASLSGDAIRALVTRVLLSGIRHLDLAEMYGNQFEIGILFNELWGSHGTADSIRGMPQRRDVFITSKIWTTNMHPMHVHSTLVHTLKELHLEYLDAWLIHWPVPMVHTTIENPSKGKAWPEDEKGNTVFAKGYSICDTWLAMEKDVQLGLTRHLGVSNFSPSLLHMLLGCIDQVHPIVNQVEVHPYHPNHQLFTFCQKNNITMQGYSPLANGNQGDGQYNVFKESSVVRASLNHDVSPAEILYQWNLQRGVPFVSSTRRHERIQTMLVPKDLILTEVEMTGIHAISLRHQYVVPKQFEFLFLS